MAKQSKTKKAETIGKGKVTPMQIAFIVDRYLSDNNYSQTRSTFRSEASHLISKSPVHEAPRTLLTLGAILEEYISLKEQKVILEQERCRLDQEKVRVQNFLRGMQDVMNAYNASAIPPPPLPPPPPPSDAGPSIPATGALVDLADGSPLAPGCYTKGSTSATMTTSRAQSNTVGPINFSTPVGSLSKRKGFKDVPSTAVIAKKSRRGSATNQIPVKDTQSLGQPGNIDNHPSFLTNTAVESSVHHNLPNTLPFQGASVVKCLFNKSGKSPAVTTAVPNTPPNASSSLNDQYVSPLEISSTAPSSNHVTPQQMTSSNCTIISTETIRVSPAKQIGYYSIERNQCISASSPVKKSFKRSNKREHVKGRLDFDASDLATNSQASPQDVITTSESNRGDFFDLDLSNLEALGMDFNLSELLVDFDLADDMTCQPMLHSLPESLSGSPNTSEDGSLISNQVMSHLSSTVTEVISEKDTSLPAGPDSVTTVKSMTKRVMILSPAKCHRSNVDQEKYSARS